MKVERVSYDTITPSAARGVLEAIHWNFQAPCLGTREFPASFVLLESGASAPPVHEALSGERDLGWMLHDMDFADGMTPRFFRARMIDGRIAVPALASAEIRS